jgi:hypothetical protein
MPDPALPTVFQAQGFFSPLVWGLSRWLAFGNWDEIKKKKLGRQNWTNPL